MSRLEKELKRINDLVFREGPDDEQYYVQKLTLAEISILNDNIEKMNETLEEVKDIIERRRFDEDADRMLD